MRLSRADFYSPCKSFLKIEFAPQDITAFGGLELMRRYLALIDLGRRVRTGFARYEIGGDYRCIDMILVILVLILVGGRRLDHLNYICDDPLVKRFCGLVAATARAQRGAVAQALYPEVAASIGRDSTVRSSVRRSRSSRWRD